MKIGGFQKMTVLDFPGKIACIIFTHGCNFKCPFCHNARLVTEDGDFFDEEEILSYLIKRRGILDGVCISGGEPLIHGEAIFELMRKIKELGFLIKLDTNGYLPNKLKYAIDNGLVDYVAMDIKNSPDKYPQTAGIDIVDMEKIKSSIEIIMSSSVDYEFRTTVTKELHTPEDFVEIGKLIRGAKRYYIQNFVDSGGIISEGSSPLENQGLTALLEAISPYVPGALIRGQ